MKITIVTGFFLPVPPVQGGSTEKIWHRLARHFVAAGHEVTFVSRAWPGFAPREIADGVRHLRIPGADHSRSLAVNLLNDLRWGVRVARVLPAADIVVCNSPTLPVWLSRRRPNAGRVVAVMARMPKGQARAYGRVDLLLALSDAVAAALRAENPRLADRIVAFPFPIDWPLHAQAADHAAPPSPATIGYAGRIHPEKGLRLLLAAAAKLAGRTDLPPWRLAIVGPWTVAQGGAGESFRQELLTHFGDVLRPRLAWHEPEFEAAALARHYGAMDVFCYPSLAEKGETFGVAVAEAMAAGAAPVVSALGCFREMVQDEKTGLVFNHSAPDAAERLAAALARLLANPVERKSIAAQAQAAARRFDYPKVSRQVLEHFARLTGNIAVGPPIDPLSAVRTDAANPVKPHA